MQDFVGSSFQCQALVAAASVLRVPECFDHRYWLILPHEVE